MKWAEWNSSFTSETKIRQPFYLPALYRQPPRELAHTVQYALWNGDTYCTQRAETTFLTLPCRRTVQPPTVSLEATFTPPSTQPCTLWSHDAEALITASVQCFLFTFCDVLGHFISTVHHILYVLTLLQYHRVAPGRKVILCHSDGIYWSVSIPFCSVCSIPPVPLEGFQ